MDSRFVEEYRYILKEMQETRTCITDYMKMFFSIAVAITGGAAGLLAYVAANSDPKTSIAMLLSIYGPYIGFVLLFLAYSILTFSTILFHKFNTHNRYTGYARTLEMERILPESAEPAIFLWESGVGGIYRREDSIHKIDMEDAALVCNLRSRICEHPIRYFWITAVAVVIGFLMIFRSTIFRHATNSWTYPYQVSFGVFAPTVFLGFAWFFWSYPSLSQAGVPPSVAAIQEGLAVFLLLSWLGLANRMYRLCAHDGDRTIETYNQKFMIGRDKQLRARGAAMNAVYYGTPARLGSVIKLLAPWAGPRRPKLTPNKAPSD